MRTLIYSNLEAELTRAGLKKADLARMINISSTALSSKFTGRTDFTLKQMRTIKRILEKVTAQELTLDYLFKRD